MKKLQILVVEKRIEVIDLTEISYTVIGQSSPHEIYILNGVKGGVIALIDKNLSENCINEVIFAIRCHLLDNHFIRPEFIDENIIFGGYYLSSRWVWRGRGNSEYPELNKYKAYFTNTFGSEYDREYDRESKCINNIEKSFKVIKDVYDRNTSR